MKNGFRQSMAWLHTWAGLVVGWLLFAIFLTGTVAYFRAEITQWMEPELRHRQETRDAGAHAVQWLRRHAPESSAWLIDLPDERNSAIRVLWRDEKTRRAERAVLDPSTGLPVAVRATHGGGFFYYFHFDLMMPSKAGRWIVSAASMIMLIAIVSGVITHRRIFRDFFTFRPRRGQRSWLDAHNLLGVLALPYHAMITYTGLVTLMFLYMPWGLDAAYPDGRQSFNQAVYAIPLPTAPARGAAPLAPIEPMLDRASRHWQGGRPGNVRIEHPGDANARVLITRRDADRISVNRQALLFDGVSGHVLSIFGTARAALETRGVLYGLHLGRFAGPVLRGLFFLSGLIGTAMIATGLLLWVAKRAPSETGTGRAGFGYRLVRGLNVGTIAGLPIAMAAFFWANRLLPADLPGRADWEMRCFFLIWLLALLYPCVRPATKAWQEQLWTGGVLFGALPILNALTTERHLGVSIPSGDWVFAGFDLSALMAGAFFIVAAHTIRRKRRGAASVSIQREAAE